MVKRKKQMGSTFNAFLQEQGIADDTNSLAIKRVIAWQLQEAMRQDGISKNQMAKAMQTSRSQLDRILDPQNNGIQLDTIMKAAHVLGRELRIELV
jgi:DNA-binding phage protein